MPIIIDELTVNVNVDETPASSGNRPAGTHLTEQDQRTLIAACAEQVLDILNQKKER